MIIRVSRFLEVCGVGECRGCGDFGDGRWVSRVCECWLMGDGIVCCWGDGKRSCMSDGKFSSGCSVDCWCWSQMSGGVCWGGVCGGGVCGCSVGQRSSDFSDGGSYDWSWGGVGQRSVSNGGSSNWSSGDSFDGNRGRFFADYSVESVDWVSDVVDGASGSIRFQQGVATLDNVSVAGFLLALGVTGQAVVDIIGVAVLRMRIVVSVHGLSNRGYRHGFRYGGYSHGRRGVGQRSRRSVGQLTSGDESSVGSSQKGGESDELEELRLS